MKKLIVIGLVLIVASVANAGLTWTANLGYGTGVMTATLSSDTYAKAINIYQMTSSAAGTWAITTNPSVD